MKGAKITFNIYSFAHFVRILAFVVLFLKQDSNGASHFVSGLSMCVISAPPGLERVWNVLEPMVQEARDTGQTELEVRYSHHFGFRETSTSCPQHGIPRNVHLMPFPFEANLLRRLAQLPRPDLDAHSIRAHLLHVAYSTGTNRPPSSSTPFPSRLLHPMPPLAPDP
jgi:hypothetical protein